MKVHPSLGPEDSLGGHTKQLRDVPEDVAIRTDADLTNHLRERERANAATSPSVAGIPELTPHADKRDLPPTAPGKSTRVDRSSDGVISKPFSHVEHNKAAKDVHGGDFSLGAQGRKRPASSQVEDVKERDVKKLHDAKRKQFGTSGTN